ncbi:MAG TPA: NAD kinase [Paludibacteraceae bacterium]|jgi:NAD+ kinase|nr:NAD kinase [Paludibacteraceae bacterium]OPZ02326.1 MAG: Inorganic polyphosphate/ATP-NAD kinase [Bacteroidetes bacterium ADurb.BinA395]MBP8966724.1 NAD kinase [Paludibacteraceae bacterium]HOF98650.1 NAD kinase [Paludibacteraceae bacterium]HOJ65808.1 NAD kinase [Paludibacteraceae bacterium]
MKVAIFGNIYRPVIINSIKVLFDFFSEKQIPLMLDSDLYDFLVHIGGYRLENVEKIENDNFKADVALSIGGDGTFLNTAARIGDKEIPIIGINTGRLGFLTDVSNDEIIEALEALLEGKFRIEERTLLLVKTSDGTPLQYPYALNEVSVLKQDSSSMISINASVNGELIHTYQADGLLVSTPTGSTAYSMSVGGPIVVPQAQNFILSPVASHSLNVRPLIIPDNWNIDLEVHSRTHSYLVALDGRSKVLEQTTQLHIAKAPFTIKVIKQLQHTFFDTLKKKLMWGVDKRN